MHVQLQDSHACTCETVILPNTAWLSLNYLEKTFLDAFLGGETNQPTKQKDSSQSTTHFAFQGVEEDWTMNKPSPVTRWWRGSSFGGVVASLSLAFSLALAVISEPTTMAAQVS